jgi:hypothetical protein
MKKEKEEKIGYWTCSKCRRKNNGERVCPDCGNIFINNKN